MSLSGDGYRDVRMPDVHDQNDARGKRRRKRCDGLIRVRRVPSLVLETVVKDKGLAVRVAAMHDKRTSAVRS